MIDFIVNSCYEILDNLCCNLLCRSFDGEWKWFRKKGFFIRLIKRLTHTVLLNQKTQYNIDIVINIDERYQICVDCGQSGGGSTIT